MRTVFAFFNGMREFRSSVTTRYKDYRHYEAYDHGRELAHVLTLRYFDH